MAVSRNLTATINFLAFMCSIPIITAGIWLASKQDNECIHWLRWPVVFMGIAFLVVTLTGFVGAYWKKEGLLGLYLVCMAILIVLLLSFLILAFVVTRDSGAYNVPGRGYKEYSLEGFSSWMREHITSDDNWGGIRGCLAETGICPKLSHRYITADHFFAAHLSPIESGCCKPPTICGYQYVNPTMWINPVNSVANADCSLWNNDPSQLCYYCDSCKAGLLGNLRREWRKANIILIVSIVVLIFVYLVGCNAFRHVQSDALFGRKK
ncbi:hypothetical protein Leryth_013733 [Lithospermum erythrorhizon]|nr:hypothetical protein Leryth_013733 [Lithospermum erythrorhizon]